MSDKFSICRAFTRKWEAGYVNNTNDPGGATNMGITIHTLANFRGRAVTPDDVRNLTSDEADAIYKQNYYDPCNCESLPTPLAIVVFDAAINSGNFRSVMFLQEALGVTADGSNGVGTQTAAARCDTRNVAQAAIQWRLKFCNGLPAWQYFGAGWTNRCQDLARYVTQYL